MKSLKTGFTLIELLVVIAIIALLTGIIVANLTQSKGKARDAKRVSDIGNLQLSLELYFDRCKAYPSSLSTSANNAYGGGTCGSITLGTFVSKIATPPAGSSQTNYTYAVNGNNTDYILEADLEYGNPATQDDIDSTSLPVDCSDGTPIHYCVGPK